MDVCRNSSKRTYMMKIVSTMKTPETTYLKHMECRSREWTVTVCEQQRKELKCKVESNTPFDVPIMMSEHADGSSELSTETEDAAEVEWCGCACDFLLRHASNATLPLTTDQCQSTNCIHCSMPTFQPPRDHHRSIIPSSTSAQHGRRNASKITLF